MCVEVMHCIWRPDLSSSEELAVCLLERSINMCSFLFECGYDEVGMRGGMMMLVMNACMDMGRDEGRADVLK